MFVLLAPLAAQNVNPYSIEKEQALGNQLATAYRRGATLPDNAAVNAYLTGLGRRIAAHAGGPAYPYTFVLVEDDRIFLHEPVAFPGGKIFVSTGLILAAASEEELAGMLAHSIAHIAAHHGVKQGARNTPIPLIFMGGWQGYAVPQDQSMAVPLGFVKAYRQNELDADALAVQAMAAAGYNPTSLIDYITRLQPADALPTPATRPTPDRDARLTALRAAIEKLPAATYPAHDNFAAIQEQVKRAEAKPAKAPPRLAR